MEYSNKSDKLINPEIPRKRGRPKTKISLEDLEKENQRLKSELEVKLEPVPQKTHELPEDLEYLSVEDLKEVSLYSFKYYKKLLKAMKFGDMKVKPKFKSFVNDMKVKIAQTKAKEISEEIESDNSDDLIEFGG